MNDPKCSELGWKCTPLTVETYGCWGAGARETLAVETYGCWGAEARETLSHLATRLAIPMRCTKSQATAAIYGRLSLTLVRSCARALLSRARPSLVVTGRQYFWFPLLFLVYIILCIIAINKNNNKSNPPPPPNKKSDNNIVFK